MTRKTTHFSEYVFQRVDIGPIRMLRRRSKQCDAYQSVDGPYKMVSITFRPGGKPKFSICFPI